jgi:hypothetical protein
MSKFFINWLPEGDTIPRYERWREKRIIPNNNWISSIGIPNGFRVYKIYIPRDSIHIVLANELNAKFFSENAKEKITIIN